MMVWSVLWSHADPSQAGFFVYSDVTPRAAYLSRRRFLGGRRDERGGASSQLPSRAQAGV